MAGRIFDVPPLTEEETRQLQSLLVRYLTYHADGLIGAALTGLISKVRGKPELIEAMPPELPKRHRERHSSKE